MKKISLGIVLVLTCCALILRAEDTPPLSTPQHVSATALGNNRIVITWDRPADPDVYGYEIYRDGRYFATRGGTSFPRRYIFDSFTGSVAKSYTVRTFDRDGNMSEFSSPVSINSVSAPRGQTTVYVDNSLSADITDGTYSVANRSSDGFDGNAYRRIQAAIAAINPGDHVLVRNGVYYEHDIEIPRDNNGLSWNEGEYNLVASYPGEWASVNADYQGNCIFFSAGTAGNCLRFWRFERLEVTGAGKNPDLVPYDASYGGKGFYFWPAKDVEIRYCYIHHNHGGISPNGGSGISMANENGGGALRVKILYNVIADNGWPGIVGENIQNINIYGDYHYECSTVNTDNAVQHNEIAYNLIKGSSIGIKMKSVQRLVKDTSGSLPTSLDYKTLGDKIHHNIIIGPNFDGIHYRQDFQQIYNNIVDVRPIKATGMHPGVYSSGEGDRREPFYTMVYNNTILGAIPLETNTKTAFSFQHDQVVTGAGGNYDAFAEGYHPYLWCLNNLIHHAAGDELFYIQLNTCYGVHPDPVTFKWDTIHIKNNYFADRSTAAKIIRMGHYSDNLSYSASQFESAGYGQSIYTQVADLNDLFSSENHYKTNALHKVGRENLTISNAGAGGPHPYLEGVTIPSYIGAVNPNDNAWVDAVQNLGFVDNTGIPVNLRNAINGSMPTWIEGSGMPQDTTAPTVPTNLLGYAVSSTQINLTWTASTDGVGVSGYRIYRNGTQIATSETTAYNDSNLCASTQYSYTVAAYDAAGNVSDQSTVMNISTADAGVVLLADDFEDGQPLSSKYEDISEAGLSVVTQDSFSATHSLQQHYNQGQVDAGWIIKVNNEGYPDHLFMRWYHKFEHEFDGFPPKMARIRCRQRYGDWTSSIGVHCWIENDEAVVDVSAINSTQANDVGWLPIARSGFFFTDPENADRWICFEMEVKLNTPGQTDGVYRLWIDDQLRIERKNVDLRGSTQDKFNEVALDCYWNGGSPKEQNRYYDDWVVSTGKIGMIYDATSPHPPVISPISSVTKYEGELIQFDVYISDQDAGDTITLSSSELPQGATLMKIADRIWQFSWQTDFASTGTYAVTLIANDGEANSEPLIVNIGVNNFSTMLNLTDKAKWFKN